MLYSLVVDVESQQSPFFLVTAATTNGTLRRKYRLSVLETPYPSLAVWWLQDWHLLFGFIPCKHCALFRKEDSYLHKKYGVNTFLWCKSDRDINNWVVQWISHPDWLVSSQHLVMFESLTLQGQSGIFLRQEGGDGGMYCRLTSIVLLLSCQNDAYAVVKDMEWSLLTVILNGIPKTKIRCWFYHLK